MAGRILVPKGGIGFDKPHNFGGLTILNKNILFDRAMIQDVPNNRELPITAGVFTLFLCTAFGANAVAIKISLLGLGIFTTAAFRFTLASIAIFLWAIATKRPLLLKKGQAHQLLILSLLFTVQLGLFYLGLSKTSASRGTLMINLQPFFVLLLAHYFTRKSAKEMDREPIEFTDNVLEALQCYHWPGNVRELENVIKRLMVMTEGKLIDVTDLPSLMRFSVPRMPDVTRTLAEAEAYYIRNVLASVGGNKTKAAKILSIARATLRDKIKESNNTSGIDDI